MALLRLIRVTSPTLPVVLCKLHVPHVTPCKGIKHTHLRDVAVALALGTTLHTILESQVSVTFGSARHRNKHQFGMGRLKV